MQVSNNQVWGACHLPTRSPPEQSYSAPQAYMSQMENMMPPPPPDSSKAPGYRSASQRMVNSPIGMIIFLIDHPVDFYLTWLNAMFISLWDRKNIMSCLFDVCPHSVDQLYHQYLW